MRNAYLKGTDARQAEMKGLTVDVTVSNEGITGSLSDAYTYIPSLQR